VLLKRIGSKSLAIASILPILSDFTLSLSQSKPSEMSFLQARPLGKLNFWILMIAETNLRTVPVAEFALKMSSQQKELKILTNSVEPLQQILVEIKRAVTQAREFYCINITSLC
jgi:hypothetical protein